MSKKVRLPPKAYGERKPRRPEPEIIYLRRSRFGGLTLEMRKPRAEDTQ